jgi:hypothetical protein
LYPFYIDFPPLYLKDVDLVGRFRFQLYAFRLWRLAVCEKEAHKRKADGDPSTMQGETDRIEDYGMRMAGNWTTMRLIAIGQWEMACALGAAMDDEERVRGRWGI